MAKLFKQLDGKSYKKGDVLVEKRTKKFFIFQGLQLKQPSKFRLATPVEIIRFKEVEKQKQVLAKLRKAAEPLLKYLCENYHPHTTAIVTGTSIEVLEGVHSLYKINDFVVD